MGDNPTPVDVDNFKLDFKYYKQKAATPSLDDVLDFDVPASVCEKVSRIPIGVLENVDGGRAPETWEAYEITAVPGLYFVRHVFSTEDQVSWAKTCVEEYTKSPYVTNLDTFQSKERVDAAWDDSEQLFESQNCWNRDINFLKKTPIWSMRWSTLGYHHDWNTKQYQSDLKSVFPSKLRNVCSHVAKGVGFAEFQPEAAIVNFYHVGSTLAPHRDISEADLTLPLISISLGLDAIFLIGGGTKTTKPMALLVRSGDVIVMSGNSRTAYHALPRVMDSSGLRLGDGTENFMSLYLQHSRININVRQVESEAMPFL